MARRIVVHHHDARVHFGAVLTRRWRVDGAARGRGQGIVRGGAGVSAIPAVSPAWCGGVVRTSVCG